jgi:protein-tyrosine-phosphatase
MDRRLGTAAIVVASLGLAHAGAANQRVEMHADLKKYVKSIVSEIEAVPGDRRLELNRLADFVRAKKKAGKPAQLLFICTHNSRRSHMGQIWAAAAAAYYQIDGVRTFSGGTEVTAFNPRAVSALSRAGLRIEGGEGKNPRYRVTFAEGQAPIEAFSKKYDDAANPKTDFAAVMTCGQADASCPLVKGAALRVPLHYEDPKLADGSKEEAATYDARTRQIATEMFYLFSRVGA